MKGNGNGNWNMNVNDEFYFIHTEKNGERKEKRKKEIKKDAIEEIMIGIEKMKWMDDRLGLCDWIEYRVKYILNLID